MLPRTFSGSESPSVLSLSTQTSILPRFLGVVSTGSYWASPQPGWKTSSPGSESPLAPRRLCTRTCTLWTHPAVPNTRPWRARAFLGGSSGSVGKVDWWGSARKIWPLAPLDQLWLGACWSHPPTFIWGGLKSWADPRASILRQMWRLSFHNTGCKRECSDRLVDAGHHPLPEVVRQRCVAVGRRWRSGEVPRERAPP